MAEEVGAPARQIATFGGMIRVAVNTTTTLLVTNGVTFQGTCAPSTEDPTQNMASVIVSSDDPGTWYSSLDLYTGDITEVNPPSAGVAVYTYDAGCDQPGGPILIGGIHFSICKPTSAIAINGIMSVGVGVLGGDSVFSGMVIL